MKRTWTEVGGKYTDGNHGKFSAMFDRMAWQSIPCTLPMAPGEALKEVIKELRIPKVDQVAYSHELAPYGLMGLKAHYLNGDATVFMADEGDSIVILASDFYPN